MGTPGGCSRTPTTKSRLCRLPIRNRDCGHSTKYDRDLRITVVGSVPSDPLARTYGVDMPEALVPLVVLLAILAIGLWVYADARRGAVRGAPVVARIGSFAVETPDTWFLGG